MPDDDAVDLRVPVVIGVEFLELLPASDDDVSGPSFDAAEVGSGRRPRAAVNARSSAFHGANIRA